MLVLRMKIDVRFLPPSSVFVVHWLLCVYVTAVRHGERNAPVQAAAGPSRSQGRPEVRVEGGQLCADYAGASMLQALPANVAPDMAYKYVVKFPLLLKMDFLAVIRSTHYTSNALFSTGKGMGVGIFFPRATPRAARVVAVNSSAGGLSIVFR